MRLARWDGAGPAEVLARTGTPGVRVTVGGGGGGQGE